MPNGVQLPEVIAIDEYKADTDEGKYQLIIANAETHEPIDILPNRRKDTISHYLSEYGSNVKMVVMDVNPAVAVKNIKSTCNYRRSVSLLSLYSLGYR